MRVRVLFWNTFLLKVLLGEVLPAPPGLRRLVVHRKPAVTARAAEIGQVLCAGDYDVMALAEVFDEAELDRMVEAWRKAGLAEPMECVGPEPPERGRWSVGGKSSGLVTLTPPRRRAVRFGTRAYGRAGARHRDSDAWASKGILLVEVDLGLPDVRLELYSTHLFYGGDLVPGRRDAADEARHRVRMAQVDELLEVVAQWHRPGNVALVCGDFNIAADDTEGSGGARLRDRMAVGGFEDLWPAHGSGPGYTCDLLVPDGPTERIDYMFLRRSDASDRVAAPSTQVTVAGLRCVAFSRRHDAAGVAEIAFLSDHAALEVDLDIVVGIDRDSAPEPGDRG